MWCLGLPSCASKPLSSSAAVPCSSKHTTRVPLAASLFVNQQLCTSGTAGKSNPQSFVADFAVFNPATGESKALAPLQMARGNAQMVATDDGRLMVLGGRTFVNDEAIVRASIPCLYPSPPRGA